MEWLVDSYVRFEDIKDAGGDEAMEMDRDVAMEMDLDGLPESRKRKRGTVAKRERLKHEACCTGAVRKLPVTGNDARFYRKLLDGMEPCLSLAIDVPNLACLSIKIFHVPTRSKHLLRDQGLRFAFIKSCHKSCFALHAGLLRDNEPNFYLVYDIYANSVAIIPPPLSACSPNRRSNIGGGVGLLCCDDKRGDYILAQVLRHRHRQRRLPTNNATLLTWESLGSGQWIEKEVWLPLPTMEVEGIVFCPFKADFVFALGSISLCWVDLATGILVYNHCIDDTQHGSSFHFIPLPKGTATTTGRPGKRPPKEYRSMGCTEAGRTLKFVSMEGYATDHLPISEVILTTWTLMQPLRPNHWEWKDSVCFRIGDLFNDPLYKDELRLQPLRPCFPVISAVEPDLIYLTVIDQEFNHELQSRKARQLYILGLDMHSKRVISAVKGPRDGYNSFISQLMTSTVRCYQNEGGKLDGSGDLHKDCPRGKETSD